MKYPVFLLFLALSREVLTLPSNGYTLSKNPGGVVDEELAIPKEVLEEVIPTYYADPETGEIIAEGLDAGTMCLIDCINQIERVEVDLPSNSEMKEEFGPWMDVPYRTFVFQTVCGSYKQRKSCLDQCPNSEAKRVTNAAMGPLDFICIDHYQDFLNNMGCLLSAKKKITETCKNQCGSMNDIVLLIQNLQQQNGDPVDKTNEAMSYLCQFADCRQECFRPILKENCGDKASKLIDRFSSSSSRAFLKELDTLGYVGVSPEACAKLEIKEEALREWEVEEDLSDEIKDEALAEFSRILDSNTPNQQTNQEDEFENPAYFPNPDTVYPAGVENFGAAPPIPALPVEIPSLDGNYDANGNWIPDAQWQTEQATSVDQWEVPSEWETPIEVNQWEAPPEVIEQWPINTEADVVQAPQTNETPVGQNGDGYWDEYGRWVDLSGSFDYPEVEYYPADPIPAPGPVDNSVLPDVNPPPPPTEAPADLQELEVEKRIGEEFVENRFVQEEKNEENHKLSTTLIILSIIGGVAVAMLVIMLAFRRYKSRKVTLVGDVPAKVQIFQKFSDSPTPHGSPKSSHSSLPY